MACPFRCIYCDQHKITGVDYLLGRKEVVQVIEEHLITIPKKRRHVEIAFFGGNFTGLNEETQEYYLSIAQNYVDSGKVQGIRLSTRPDYIDEDKLKLLNRYDVSSIELGAQSLDDEVLAKCGRGHTAADVENASKLIKQFGFNLGLQMMIGLPGDSPAKALETAKKIIALGANESRIYPCLVVRDTHLHKLYEQRNYRPLELDEAVSLTADLLLLFELNGVKVIRIGLHPSDDLKGRNLIAGPFHESFKELVLSEIWNRKFKSLLDWPQCEQIRIEVPPQELNFAVGYKGLNKNGLKNIYHKVLFKTNSNLSSRQFLVYPLSS